MNSIKITLGAYRLGDDLQKKLAAVVDALEPDISIKIHAGSDYIGIIGAAKDSKRIIDRGGINNSQTSSTTRRQNVEKEKMKRWRERG